MLLSAAKQLCCNAVFQSSIYLVRDFVCPSKIRRIGFRFVKKTPPWILPDQKSPSDWLLAADIALHRDGQPLGQVIPQAGITEGMQLDDERKSP
ncbi:jg12357 [Pararge aegeria aegeria]|uniref:Jg12357 protein n=1 Tax=Pararge aegeria aegeria TaxID=348720 RepID=A0A8S4R8G6_9NEOP|nr:jg12357 [Pararge aegeria aegeria]